MLRFSKRVSLTCIVYELSIGRKRVAGMERWLNYEYDTYGVQFFYHGPLAHMQLTFCRD